MGLFGFSERAEKVPGTRMEPQLANEPGRIGERLPIHLELNRRIGTRQITALDLLAVLRNQRIADGHAAGESEQEGKKV